MKYNGLIAIGIIAIIIFGIIFIVHDYKSSHVSNEEINALTDYLNSKQITIYYRPDCEYCIEQEKYINFTRLKYKVDINNATSYPKSVLGTPTWITLDGNAHVGMMTTKQLEAEYGFKQ